MVAETGQDTYQGPERGLGAEWGLGLPPLTLFSGADIAF
jgi:hypothetical protein